MAKVLVLANDYTTILHFRMELLRALLSEGHGVTLGLPDHAKNEAFRAIGCQVVPVKLNRFGMNPLQDLGLLWHYLALFRRVRPDIVLTYTAKPNIYGGIACRIARIPYLCNVTGLGSNFQREGLIKRVMLTLQKIAYRKARRVFFQNKSNQAYFEERRIVNGNGALLPGSGVNLTLNPYEPYPPGDGKLRFITVSRVRKDKGFDELFEAIRGCAKEDPRLEFHLAGWYESDEYERKTGAMARDHPLVVHGSVSQADVHRLIAHCDCLIHPSYHEGMANALMEASAAGRPCLASDVPGCREPVEDGETGFLFKVKDAQGLKQAILRFAALPHGQKERMGVKAREKMEKEFDRQFVIDAYLKEIGKILG